MTSNIVFVGIDGTGDSNDAAYAEAFTWSYVKAIHDRIPAQDKLYLRGPALLGTATTSLAVRAVERVTLAISNYNKSDSLQFRHALTTPTSLLRKPLPVDSLGEWPPRLKVCLAGYSRGGAAVVFAAKKLEEMSIVVDYLILFDAVDRSPMPCDSFIPANVRQVWHAMRHPDAGSREIFGNTATSPKAGTQYDKFECMTTHGGMGGTPWCTSPAIKKDFQRVNGQASPKWKEEISEVDHKPSRFPSNFEDVRATTAVHGFAGPSVWRSTGLDLRMANTTPAYSAGPSVAQQVAKMINKTNLTFEQDLDGSQLAWKWMVSKLGGLGIGHSWPLADVRGQLENGNLTRRK